MTSPPAPRAVFAAVAMMILGSSAAPAQTCGFSISDAAGSQTSPRVVSDGAGGVYAAWVDAASGVARIVVGRFERPRHQGTVFRATTSAWR